MRNISEIIIHCTSTPEGKDYSAEQIRNWHKNRGFSDIGYHYVIHPDGRVENGRPLSLVGAHCLGHNAGSIGIAYIGGMAAQGKHYKNTHAHPSRNRRWRRSSETSNPPTPSARTSTATTNTVSNAVPASTCRSGGKNGEYEGGELCKGTKKIPAVPYWGPARLLCLSQKF